MKPDVTIYTDGGCWPNPGPGGWGVVLIHGGRIKKLSGNCSEATNNRMELTAAIEALRALKTPCRITLISDSEYLVKGITLWVDGWIRRGWRTAAKKPVENRDLWMALREETQRHEIEWQHVRGHSGDTYNEMADRLATEARQALAGG
jgi:ribonuclease HI